MNLTRRGFIGAAGAAAGSLLVPSWLQFRQRRTIDLTPFCDSHGDFLRRYDMRRPYAQDEQVYATDGKICVRTLLDDVPDLGDEVKLPPASSLPFWSKIAPDTRWQKWPRRKWIADGDSNPCPVCWKRGGLNATICRRCEGDGECGYDASGGFIDNCNRCKGTGWERVVDCEYCAGTGWTEKPAIQLVGSAAIDGGYDAKLRAFGDLEYMQVEWRDYLNDRGSVTVFRGDGFEGVVMPIVRRK